MSTYRLYEKTGTTDPRTWSEVEDLQVRNLDVRTISDQKAIVASARLQQNATHYGRGEYDAEYKVGRRLVDQVSKEEFIILHVRDAGRRRPGATHSSKVKLTLTEHII